MRAAYRVPGLTIAGLVVIQAAAIAFAMFGVLHFVDDGNALNKSLVDDRTGFDRCHRDEHPQLSGRW